MSRWVAAALSVALWCACADDTQGEVVVQMADADDYLRDVHPIVNRTCGTLDCHGVPGRPLRIYTEDSLRASDALRGQPLSQGEVDDNVRAFSGVSLAGAGDDHLALTKPLAIDAGGASHVGGELWASRDHPAYLCLRSWLAGQSDPAVCQSAMAELP